MRIQDIQQVNGLSLAYLGDAAWEIVVREHLIYQAQFKPNELHRRATAFVKASGQAAIIQALLSADILTDAEIQAFKRGRNMKSHTSAKNASTQDYRLATGFESLCGYLYLQEDSTRFEMITQYGVRYIEENLIGETR